MDKKRFGRRAIRNAAMAACMLACTAGLCLAQITDPPQMPKPGGPGPTDPVPKPPDPRPEPPFPTPLPPSPTPTPAPQPVPPP